MNIAFPAIFLFLLLLPGFLFHHYFQNRDARAADLTPFSITFFHIAVFAIIFNLLAMAVAYLFDYRFHLGTILHLFMNSPANQAALQPLYRWLDDHPTEPLLFFICSNVLAFGFATFWRYTVQHYKLDHPSCSLYQWFRPRAPWYYLFSGIDAPTEKVDCTVIAAVVTFKDCSYLYTGILVDYELTEKGELDRLVLSNTARRKLTADRQDPDSEGFVEDNQRFYPINGDYFVLHTVEYTTLNIRYLRIEDPPSRPPNKDA